MDLGMALNQGCGYWKLNKFILFCDTFRNLIKVLVQRTLTGKVLNNCWWLNLKRAIRHDSIGFCKQLSLVKIRMNHLEEALRLCSAYQIFVVMLAPDRHLKEKHECCIVRTKEKTL